MTVMEKLDHIEVPTRQDAHVGSVTAPAADWIKSLAFIAPAMDRRPPSPILSMAFIDPGMPLVRTFDYETSATCWLGDDAEAAAQGEPFLVPYRWLVDAIRTITSRDRSVPVTVEVAEAVAGHHVTVSAGGYQLHAPTQPAAEYPAVHFGKATTEFVVDAQDFRAAMAKVAVAAGKDEMYPILTAIKFELEPGKLVMLATDRYRLASHAVEVPNPKTSRGFAIKHTKLQAFTKNLKAGLLHVEISPEGIRLAADGGVYTTLLADGDYPKIAQLFEGRDAAVFEADRVGLLEAAKAAERLSERNTPCTLKIERSGITVTFADGLFGPSRAPLVPGRYVGGNEEIAVVAFNPRYLLESLSTFNTSTVRISRGHNVNTPWLVTEAPDEAGAIGPHRHLLMPVRNPGTY